MKLTFLGTSAAEEYPGIWCGCENCEKARMLGGKNIRRNSSIMIDGDTMIDIGKTAHVQAKRFGLDLRGIRTLLVTHAHSDHFDTHMLWARNMTTGCGGLRGCERLAASSPRFTELPALAILGSKQVAAALESEVDYAAPGSGLNFIVICPYEEHTAGGWEIVTLDGNHTDGDGRSINYILSRKGRTFLYLTDSGWPFDKTLDTIARYKYDFIITEGTFGYGADSEGHMRLDKNIRLLEFFNKNRLWKNEPAYYLTHLAPHWCPPHDEYAPVVEANGMRLAFDGLELEYPY